MNASEKALAIAEISSLKARYWHAVDIKDASRLRACFSDDAIIPKHGDVAEERDADGFVANLVSALKDTQSLHLGGPGDISILSEQMATGIWAVEDRIWVTGTSSSLGFKSLHGWGHYYDKYRRTDDGWKIQSFILKRVRINIE